MSLAVGQAIGRETRAKHNNATGGALSWTGESSLYCMAPMINVCQDVRWGRCQEGNGEDPFLGHEFGAMYSMGYQDDEGTGVLKALATPKHFGVFNGPGDGGGEPVTGVTISKRDKMTTHEPPFRGAFLKGNARSVMCAYDRVQGVHNCANRELLTTTLRDDWGFDGHVISDGGAVGSMADRSVSSNPAFPTTDDAVNAALHAGCDVGMGHAYLGLPLDANHTHGNAGRDGIEAMVANGTISIDIVGRAALRVLTNRIMLGELIDSTSANPWRNLTLVDELVKNKPLAQRAASESVVLLRNRGGTLPIEASNLMSVAVVGPSADSLAAYIGDYAPQPDYYTTVFSAAKVALPHATYLETAPGCFDIFCGNCTWELPIAPKPCVNKTDFAPAVAAAGKAKDLVVWVGGLNGTFNYAEGEGTKHDRGSVLLLGQQEALMIATHAAAKKAGAKIVVVLLGSAVAATWAEANADAVISAGYGGQEAGTAIVPTPGSIYT